MPINNITQTISTLPPAGRRGIDVQTQFVIKQEDFQDHLQGITVTEFNTLKDQLNSRIGEINSTTTTMNGYANTASAGASTATTKAGEASTSASEALTSKNQAETFKNNASASATKASQWADNNYNVTVETGKYSAKHWSTVAQNTVNNKIDKVVSTDNAVVRFNGTTGEVQNSAITIEDNGNIGSGTQSFNGFGGSGFKNYIINGNFNVWQRGTSFSAVGYCADRWHLAIGGSANAMKHNVSPNTILVSTTADSSLANLYQAIETATVMGLRGKTLTLSLKLQTGGTHMGGFTLSAKYSNSTDTLNSQTTTIQGLGISASSTNTRYSLTFTIPADAVGLRIDIENTSVQPSGALYQVQEVQLEEGSVATPFEQRPYGLELSLCQRYYEVSGLLLTTISGDFPTGYWKVSKRTAPTISLSIGIGSGATVIPNISTDLTIGFYQNTPNSLATYSNVTASAEL